MDDGEDGSFSEFSNHNTNWPHKSVLLLINLYKKYLPKFNSKSIKKKGVWNLLALEMKKNGFDLTGEACDKKFRALKHRYKIIFENSNATGRKIKRWEYFDLMSKLLEDDPQFKVNSPSGESHDEEDIPPEEEDPSKDSVIWTHSRKLLLLKLCKDHCNNSSDNIWETIADGMKSKGCVISADMCEKKFKTFKYRFKKIMECDDPIYEGNKWVYFEIVKSLLEGDSIYKQKASNTVAVTSSSFKIVVTNPDDIVTKSMINSFKEEGLEEEHALNTKSAHMNHTSPPSHGVRKGDEPCTPLESNIILGPNPLETSRGNQLRHPFTMYKDTDVRAQNENEDLSNGNEAVGDLSDTNMIDELEDAQDDSLSGTYVSSIWSHRAILMLIKLYKMHISHFKSKSVKKFEVWKMISTKMESMGHNYSAEACDRKFRCLKYRYSKILADTDTNNRGKKWLYFQDMSSVFETDTTNSESIQIVSTMTLPPGEIETYSSPTSNFDVRKSSSTSTANIRGRGSSPPPRKRTKNSIYDEPPSWFLSFVESQNKHMEEVKTLQRASLKVAKERNTILKSFTDILLKKMKSKK